MSGVLSSDSEVRGEIGFLPGHRIVPHGNAVENFERRTADWRKDNYVVLRAEVRLVRDGLRTDVIEGHARSVEGIAPPTFRLRAKPGVHESDARRSYCVGRDGWGRGESGCIE